MSDNKLAIMEVKDTEVASLSERLLPMWPKDLNREQARQMATVALAYGLDPFLGELIPYRGEPYITVDGMLRKARETDKWEGIIEDRPATREEYAALKVDPSDMLWFLSVKRVGWLKPNGAYARARLREDPNVVAKMYLFEMARKRALYRCLREAFGTPLPGVRLEENIAVASDGATMINTMATTGQIQKIHVLKGKLGLSDEAYRNGLKNRYGVTSSKELNEFQAEDLIQEYESVLKSREDLIGDSTPVLTEEEVVRSTLQNPTPESEDPLLQHVRGMKPTQSIPQASPIRYDLRKEMAALVRESVQLGIEHPSGWATFDAEQMKAAVELLRASIDEKKAITSVS